MNFVKRACLISLGLLFIASPALAGSYRILVTNDDGINNPGLIALAESLSADYDVIVSAPAKNMSGNSHATNLFRGPMTVDEIPHNGKYAAYGVHGTPSDAARFGIIRMKNQGTPVNLVISGINPGNNIGSLSHLSGTIGAAMEAQYYDIPAIALNLDRAESRANGYGAATGLVKILIEKIRKNGLQKGVILNVNIPHQSKGLVMVPMGPSVIDVKGFTKTDKGQKPEIGRLNPGKDKRSNDVEAYLNGYTTVTPLKINWTAKEMLPRLEEWDLK